MECWKAPYVDFLGSQKIRVEDNPPFAQTKPCVRSDETLYPH
jgi:hypothetical protein